MKNATHITVAIFGTLVGLAGIEHGIGEILQGSLPPDGVMIASWPNSEFFRSLGGEPAMTLVPNLLVTGILAVLVSLAYLVWTIWFAPRKHGGLVLIFLAIAMLPLGAGIFPPFLGALIGGMGTRINTPVAGWQKRFAAGTLDFAGKIWPWATGLAVATWLAMLPGVALLNYFFGVDNPSLTLALLAGMFGFLFLSYVSSTVRKNPAYT